MKLVLHKDENQNTLVTCPGDISLEEVKEMFNGAIVNKDELAPFEYLNAYDLTNGELSVDLEKAKNIKVDLIRKERDEMFVDFDKRYDVAVKDGEDLSSLKEERQKLKDAPAAILERVTSMSNLTDIVNLSLEEVL